MRSWRSSSVVEVCGHCKAQIPIGSPVFVLAIRGQLFNLETLRLRCATCAGEPAPTEPPAVGLQLVRFSNGALDVTRIAQLGKQWVDGRAAAAGREPGSDDA